MRSLGIIDELRGQPASPDKDKESKTSPGKWPLKRSVRVQGGPAGGRSGFSGRIPRRLPGPQRDTNSARTGRLRSPRATSQIRLSELHSSQPPHHRHGKQSLTSTKQRSNLLIDDKLCGRPPHYAPALRSTGSGSLWAVT